MVIETAINEEIERYLVERNEEERKLHEPSGKLSASILGHPLQWQVLKVLGVPTKPFDPYTLGVFERGRQVEDWLCQRIKAKEFQKKVEYRGVVGIIDALCDYPKEIKSVKNSKFKRIVEQNHADNSHILQACLYALAEKSDKFSVVYVASDDFRVLEYVYDTKEYKNAVDEAIDAFNEALGRKTVPIFEAKEKWQSNPTYNNYNDWQLLSAEECLTKLQTEFKDAFNKLKGEKND